jgi:hypothetical protein
VSDHNNDRDICREGEAMAFEYAKDRIYSAVDPETNSRLDIDSTVDIDVLVVKFSGPIIFFSTGIFLTQKFPDQPIVPNDPQNPCVMISAELINSEFRRHQEYDIEYNTRLTEHLIRMIAFINKKYPLGTSQFLWSDYEKLPPGSALFRMPSDEDLLRLTLEPEKDLSLTAGHSDLQRG